MDILQVKDLSFRYADAKEQILQHVNLTIKEGSFVVIAGPSGCGKTTLLRLLKKEITPNGHCAGEVLYRGKSIHTWDNRMIIEEIGYVMQHPENQIIMDEVLPEIVFSMENLDYSLLEMRRRVAELVHFFGVDHLLHKKTSTLSGGQKQIINLLSTLLQQPAIIVLDEPTAQLDPIVAKNLLTLLERLHTEIGMTIILVEQRLEPLFSIADQVCLMDDGKIIYDGSSREVIASIFQAKDEKFKHYVPAISQLYMEKDPSPTVSHIPLTVKESRCWLKHHAPTTTIPLANKRNINHIEVEVKPILSVKNVFFQYGKQTDFVLKKLSFHVHKGEFYTIIGNNGSGKTTALKLCLGTVKPQRGQVYLFGKKPAKQRGKQWTRKLAYLPQNLQAYFIHDTVKKELLASVEQQQISNPIGKITEIMTDFKLQHLLDRHPYDCSSGEMQKIALISIMLQQPDILFVDEPTKGLDPISKREFASLLHKLHKGGLTIIMVTHDIEFAANYSDRCGLIFNGEITIEGTPGDIFAGNYFYTTSINRATRNSTLEDMLTLEEALKVWPEPGQL